MSTRLVRALSDASAIDGITREEAAVLLEELAALQAVLLKLLAQTPPPPTRRSVIVERDRLLTVSEVAERLAVSPRWLYRHAKDLPFTRRLTRKTIRFSEAGLRRWEGARG